MSKPQTPAPRMASRPKAAADLREAHDGLGTADGTERRSDAARETAIDNQAPAARAPGPQPKITTAIPGPKSRALFADEQSHIAPGRQRISLLAGLAFDHGEGATLTDVDGNV